MSELAAAGATFLAPSPKPVSTILEEEENKANQEAELNKKNLSNLAEPENDSISSSDEDEPEDLIKDFVDRDGGLSKSSSQSNRAKTLQPQSRNFQMSSLKRSLTLPRNPLFSLKKTKSMKSDVISISSPSKNSPNGKTTASMKSLLNRVARQISFANRHKNVASLSKCDVEERIAEWKRRFTAEDRVPGVIGIRNHGNTCFINAILQCLSYTDILAEYFVLDVYKGDLKKKKKLQASLTALYKRGAYAAGSGSSHGASDFCSRNGEVTEQLATLLKSLWSLQYDPEISIRFKSLVEKNASQYKGGSQHDAQEFLLWLLDRVHEDLNVASRRRHQRKSAANAGSKNDASNAVTDDILAAESLANYMRSNNSFVMDVFQAQFRSSLTCPTCDKQSNTFDPFLCVSLPIPQKQLMPVFVTVLYIDQTPRQGEIYFQSIEL